MSKIVTEREELRFRLVSENNWLKHTIEARDTEIEALEAENKRLKETIMELKEMQRKQTLWIAAELGLNHADTEQIVKEAIAATTTEMP